MYEKLREINHRQILKSDVENFHFICIPPVSYFSQWAQFLAKFFKTQNRVNCDKIDIMTKQQKSQQNYFATKQHKMQQNIKNCTYYLFCTQYFDLKQNV